MKKIKVGVLGGYRGTSMINYCKIADNADIVAICDNNKDVLNEQKKHCRDYNIAFYDNFKDFCATRQMPWFLPTTQMNMHRLPLLQCAPENMSFPKFCLFKQ